MNAAEAIALIHDGGRCYGAIVRNLVTGELLAYVAKATAITGGGAGRLYRVTTNAVISEGIPTAIALETGVASLGNMEAVQFHPTPAFPPGILLTEGARGDGGLLKDVDGHRFMPDYEPEKKELASRDVVSRRMEEHIAKGKGVKSRFGEHLWLDITLLGEHHIKHNLREVYEICHYFLGVDPVKEWVPVRPAQHYTMGGVRTNYTGESPTLKGLFSAGEAACWDMHGFNRLGGNSVAETVAAGMIVGEFIADFCERSDSGASIPTGLVQETLQREQAKIDALIDGRGTENAAAIMAEMQTIMTTKVGIFRSGPVLEEAVHGLQQLLVAQPQHRPALQGARRQSGAGDGLPGAENAQDGAVRRLRRAPANRKPRRSLPRGLSAPQRRRVAEPHLATWKSESDTLPSLAYEKLDVMKMELPPGWRGYGAKDHIDHPDTPRRVAEIEALKQRRDGADRFAVQEQLMPYDHLLPKPFRGRNERIDERLTERASPGDLRTR